MTYLFQLTLRQVTNSKKYKEIKPVTMININIVDVYHKGEFVYETVLMEKKFHEQYTDLFSIYDINLSYFKNIDYKTIKEGLLKDLALFVIDDENDFNEFYKGDNEVKMVKEKFDIETIIKLTGLTKEEIKDMFE